MLWLILLQTSAVFQTIGGDRMVEPSGKLLRHFGPPLGRGAGTAMRRRDVGAEKVLSPAKSAVASR